MHIARLTADEIDSVYNLERNKPRSCHDPSPAYSRATIWNSFNQPAAVEIADVHACEITYIAKFFEILIVIWDLLIFWISEDDRGIGSGRPYREAPCAVTDGIFKA